VTKKWIVMIVKTVRKRNPPAVVMGVREVRVPVLALQHKESVLLWERVLREFVVKALLILLVEAVVSPQNRDLKTVEQYNVTNVKRKHRMIRLVLIQRERIVFVL
jgi:hypothetical protein